MSLSRGFTLAEVAVAVVIVSLLLAGMIIPLTTQIELRNSAETQRTLTDIKEAIVGFALANGRLPCPADGTIAAGAANAGAEQCGPNSFGVVPWAALGVPETDAWGRRFSYWVAPIFTDAVAASTVNTPGQSPVCAPTPTPVQSSFALCSLGNLTVNTRGDTHATIALGSGLPAVIISHGKNGSGAYNTRGILLPAPAAGSDEAANATHTAAATVFYSRTPTPAASGCNDASPGSFCEFDDIVAMIPAPILVARMVSAGRLP